MERERRVMVRRGRDAWAAVLSTFGTPEHPRTCDGERLWLGSRAGWRCFDLRIPNKPKLLLLCPKRSPLEWWWPNQTLPPDVAIICTPWLADPGARSVLQPLYRSIPAAVFLGDMDPISITQYLEAKRMASGIKVALRYGGVNDAWLAAMKCSLKRQWSRSSLLIRLSRPEAALFRRLDKAIDLEQLIGPEACSILRGGHKIEIEGAMNPALYSAEHNRWIFRYLRSTGRRTAHEFG